MNDALAKKLRNGMLVASVFIVIISVGIVLLALLTPGNWIEVHESEPLMIKMEGTSIRMTGTIETDSNMPYTLKDVDISLVMIDRERASKTVLYSESGIQIYPGSNEILVDSHISASTVMLMIRDKAVKDGSPLCMELNMNCRYMLNLAEFHLTSDIRIPITTDGARLDISVDENTDDSFSVRVTGLADWLIPDNRTVSISGGGESLDLVLASNNGMLFASFHSEHGLDGVLERIASYPDAICMDDDDILDWDANTIRMLGSIMSLTRRLL